jgi:hypothetical protein
VAVLDPLPRSTDRVAVEDARGTASPIGADPLLAAAPPTAPAPPTVLPPAPPKAPAAQPARTAPAKTEAAAKRPPSPASECRKAKGADFERCLQVQCRKDRYFAHRHCIALYERAIRP